MKRKLINEMGKMMTFRFARSIAVHFFALHKYFQKFELINIYIYNI